MATRVTLSVLLPVYAGASAPHLAEALASLAGQTRPADEILVVEDGPLRRDQREVLAAATDVLPVRLLALTEHLGLAGALAAGVEAVDGSWVARMDADDIALPGRFAAQESAALAGEHDVIGTAMYEFAADPAHHQRLRRPPIHHDEIARAMVHVNPINHPTVAFKTSAVREAGSYRPLHGLEDYDLWARMLARGARFHNLPEPLLLFRADHGLSRRRKDRRLFAAEVELQHNLRSYGLATRPQVMANLVVRNGVRLLPTSVMHWVTQRAYTRES